MKKLFIHKFNDMTTQVLRLFFSASDIMEAVRGLLICCMIERGGAPYGFYNPPNPIHAPGLYLPRFSAVMSSKSRVSGHRSSPVDWSIKLNGQHLCCCFGYFAFNHCRNFAHCLLLTLWILIKLFKKCVFILIKTKEFNSEFLKSEILDSCCIFWRQICKPHTRGPPLMQFSLSRIRLMQFFANVSFSFQCT